MDLFDRFVGSEALRLLHGLTLGLLLAGAIIGLAACATTGPRVEPPGGVLAALARAEQLHDHGLVAVQLAEAGGLISPERATEARVLLAEARHHLSLARTAADAPTREAQLAAVAQLAAEAIALARRAQAAPGADAPPAPS